MSEAAVSEVEVKLSELFKSNGSGPFLFLGSGFSRRYLGLEDWKSLLQKFCYGAKPFEYYLASADGDLPKTANLITDSFNEYWWTAEECKESVERNKELIRGRTSALRIAICEYISSLDQSIAKESEYKDEIEILSGLNVDGIITTNWDFLIEQIFPEYKVYIGQEELLFSNPQEIGEIYKIHGCSSRPESLILTDDDYRDFNNRNAYLASKLITIFVEHPIIFIGYSISDKNVMEILRSISLCIGEPNIEKLRNNLIFVQRPKEGEKPGVSDTYITIDGAQIPLVLVKEDDFSNIYRAIGSVNRKIPARVLRYCKEQLYELVKASDPEEKMCVIGIDEIEKAEDIEFVVGIGALKESESAISDIGYASIQLIDIFEDLIVKERGFDPEHILDQSVKEVGKNTKNVPVFKYLKSIGIDNLETYKESGLNIDKWVLRDIVEFQLGYYASPYSIKYKGKTAAEVIDECTPENASIYIPFIEKSNIDLEVLRGFLLDNFAKIDPKNSNYASYFRKLACLYDRYKFGW